MSETAIQALERNENPKQARKNGFVPGVIYGKGMESISVKFDEKTLQKTLRGRSQKAKISVQVGDKTKQCFVQEIQKDSVVGKILHIDMQVVKEDQVVKMKVPVVFNGSEALAERKLIILPYCNEIELMGPSVDIPEYVTVDVADKTIGDKVAVGDFIVNSSLKVMDDPEKVVAAITAAK